LGDTTHDAQTFVLSYADSCNGPWTVALQGKAQAVGTWQTFTGVASSTDPRPRSFFKLEFPTRYSIYQVVVREILVIGCGSTGFWSRSAGTLWSQPYVCPNTLAPGYCVLPHFQAIELCATLPGCIWAVTTNAGWNSAFPNSAQLGFAPLISNGEWQSYTQPGPWTHVTGKLWSKQIVCNGTLAAGYCVLPVAQAVDLCATLPGCTWAVTTNAGWNNAYPKSAQLGYPPLISNAEWATYTP